MAERFETLTMFLAYTEPGDQDWSWRSQFKWLEENHHDKLRRVYWSMHAEGQHEAVKVGPDQRLWDGHHRVWAAVALGWKEILVDYIE